MPRRPIDTSTRWTIPGEAYGLVESRNGMAVFRYQGKRKALGVPFDVKRKRQILDMARTQLHVARGVKAGAMLPPTGRNVGVGRAIADFWRARAVDKRSPGVRKAMKRTFDVVFPDDFELNDDTLHAHLVQVLRDLPVKTFTITTNKKTGKNRALGPFAPSSIAKMCDELQQFFRYCQGRRWLLADPWATVPRPQAPIKGDARVLTPREVWAVLRWLKQQADHARRQPRRGPTGQTFDPLKYEEAAALLNLLRHTGMRIGEALSLHWADAVDDTTRVNTIEHDRISLRTTKTDKPREIPLSTATPQTRRIVRAVEKVRRYRQYHPVRAFRWSVKGSISRIFAAAFAACGIEDYHKAHVLRATCEQEWLRAGIDEETVVRIIGHTKKIRRKHYAEKLTAEDALNRLQRDAGRDVKATGEM